MKRGGGSKKGGRFERQICKDLSQWWAGRDDIFWRSAGSGSRAKTRGRAGKSTMGQHGDISATDPIGAPLIDAFTIEIKCGYPKQTIHDLMDGEAKSHQLLQWIEQVRESCEQSGSYTWMLIHKRDRRNALVFMPMEALNALLKAGLDVLNLHTMRLPIFTVYMVQLKDVLQWVSPVRLREEIKNL